MNVLYIVTFFISFIPCVYGIDTNLVTKNLKRKAEEIESSNKTGKIPVSNKEGAKVKYTFTCSRCKTAPQTLNGINKHMHNQCFPSSLSCLDCSSNTTFSCFEEIVKHNVEKHAQLDRWSCFACGAKISYLNYFQHFFSYTNTMNRAKYLGDYTHAKYASDVQEVKVLKNQFMLRLKENASWVSKSPVNKDVLQQGSITHWISYNFIKNDQDKVTLKKVRL